MPPGAPGGPPASRRAWAASLKVAPPHPWTTGRLAPACPATPITALAATTQVTTNFLIVTLPFVPLAARMHVGGLVLVSRAQDAAGAGCPGWESNPHGREAGEV